MTDVNVMLVDDHPLFRRGVAELLQDSGHFRVTAQFSNPDQVLEALNDTVPDLVLLDLHMPGQSGLELLQAIKERHSGVKVVMLTASDDPTHLMDALRLGAEGYLLKDTEPALILERLESILNGQLGLNDEMLLLLREGLRRQESVQDMGRPLSASASPADKHWYATLTERERETLVWISRGLSNKLIAREMGISDSTVKVYVKSLLRKLHLHSRLELAAWVHTNPLPDNILC